jgi:hypothetical protein
LAYQWYYSPRFVPKCLFLFFCSPKRGQKREFLSQEVGGTKQKGALCNAATHMPTRRRAAQGFPPPNASTTSAPTKKLSSCPFKVQNDKMIVLYD